MAPLLRLAAVPRPSPARPGQTGGRRLDGPDVGFRSDGIGLSSAARPPRAIIERLRPLAVLQIGFAGALRRGLAPGDLLLADGYYSEEPGSDVAAERISPPPAMLAAVPSGLAGSQPPPACGVTVTVAETSPATSGAGRLAAAACAVT